MVNAPNDFELIEQLLVRQPVEAMERLARHFLPSALLRRRLAACNAKICSIAVGRAGAGREIARGIHRDLRRYNAAGYEYERDRPPADPRRALMHRVLVLSRGVPSEHTIRRAPAGLGGSKSGPAMIPQAAHPSSDQEPRGGDEGCTTAEGLHRAAGR